MKAEVAGSSPVYHPKINPLVKINQFLITYINNWLVKNHLNSIIFLIGSIVLIINLYINHLRCSIVGIGIISFSHLNKITPKIKSISFKILSISILFWLLRFTLISIPTVFNFYNYLLTKIAILIILLLFFLKKIPSSLSISQKNHFFLIFVSSNLFLDLIITHYFDSTIFRQTFTYLSLIPIIFVYQPNHLP